QPRVFVGGGQPDGQRVERVVPGWGCAGDLPVGGRVAGRLGFGGGGEGDQDVLGVDDQVAHQVPNEPAGAAGREREGLVREFGDRLVQRRPAAGEEFHGGTLATDRAACPVLRCSSCGTGGGFVLNSLVMAHPSIDMQVDACVTF